MYMRQQLVEQFVASPAQEIHTAYAAFLEVLVGHEKSLQGSLVSREKLRPAQGGAGQLPTQPFHLILHLFFGVRKRIKQGGIELFDVLVQALEEFIQGVFALIEAF